MGELVLQFTSLKASSPIELIYLRMKRLQLIVFLSVLFPTFLVAQNNFTINVKIPKDFGNLNLSLVLKDEIGRYTEQEIVSRAQDGFANFSGKMLLPNKNALIELIKDGKKFSGRFVLDTGENMLNVTVNEPLYSVLNIKVKNSVSNLIKFKMDSVSQNIHDKYKAENRPVGAWSLPIQETRQLNNDYLKIINLFPTNYYSLMCLYFLSKNASMIKYEDLIINTYHKFNDELKDSELGKRILNNYERSKVASIASKIGQKMLDFTIKNAEGKDFSNKSLAGKPYVLAFGATWCVPCQEQLPELKRLYQKYKNQGLEVVYYNSDDDFMKWVTHIKNNNLNWINIAEQKDQNQLSRKLFINYVPTYLIIDKNGVISYNSDQIDPDLDQLEIYIKKVI